MAEPYPFPETPTIEQPEPIPSNTPAQEARTVVNDSINALRAALLAFVADNAAFNIAYLGAGRFVGTDISENEPVAGTGLTVRLPNDTYLVEGRVYVIDEPEPNEYQVISGVPANKPDGVDGFASIDPDTGLLEVLPENWYDTYPVTPPEGLLHIGRVETNATTVTDITPSTIEGVGIIRPRATGGGEGGGDVTQAELDAVVANYTSLINALAVRVLALENAGGTRTVTPPIDQLVHELAVVRAAVAVDEETMRRVAVLKLTGPEITALQDDGLPLRVHVIERSQSATIGPNLGSGENDTPDYEGDGDVEKTDTGTFAPA